MEEEGRPRKLQKLEHDDEPIEFQHNTENSDPSAPKGNGNDASAVVAGQQLADESTNSALTIETSEVQAKEIEEEEKDLGTTEAAPISKRQRKRLLRMQKWEEQADERRKRRREKNVQRKERRREERKNGGDDDAVQEQRYYRSVLVPVTLVIDCGWDELMNDHERVSLSQQITRAYSDNSKARYKSHLVVSSFDKLLKERFDTQMRKTHENWKGTRFMPENFVHAAEQAKDWMQGPKGGQLAGAIASGDDAAPTPTPEDGEIIYLSSDSPNTLTELKPYSTYIIGGLVDKNRHKGVCYQKATELGIKTAKLPIGEYLRLASRHVLATNHVVDIMVKWLELGDWGEAFMKVIPQRKGVALKTAKADEEEIGEESATGDAEADAAELAHDDDGEAAVEAEVAAGEE